MKIKKIILILALPLILDLIVSCCDCPNSIVYKYSFKNYEVNHLDNSGSGIIISSSNSIIKTAYGIRLTINNEQIAQNRCNPTKFIQGAYAMVDCRCPPPVIYNPIDSIIGIKIYCLTDFDNNHLANSEISEYFKVYNYHYYQTIQDYIKQWNFPIFDKSEFNSSIDLLLMSPPTFTSNSHSFKIQIYLSDNRIIEKQTTSINLH